MWDLVCDLNEKEKVEKSEKPEKRRKRSKVKIKDKTEEK